MGVLIMPAKLKNPSKRRTSKNFSIEERVFDCIEEDSDSKHITMSEIVNNILKSHYHIID